MLAPRLRKRAREERVTAVRTNPLREVLVQLVARGSSDMRGCVGCRAVELLPLDQAKRDLSCGRLIVRQCSVIPESGVHADRKSTRLNSSHGYISYAVFC